MFKLHPFLAPAIAVACVACGASFSVHEGNDALAGAGTTGEAGGPSSSAGSPSLGEAGQLETGGSSSAGQGSTAGAGGTTTSTGGTTTGAGGTTTGAGGRGNWGNGGWWTGNGGGATAADCATLRQEYEAAIDQARVCDKGSTDQCSASSVAQPVGGCGCPVPINAKSEAGIAAKKAYQAYQDAKCEYNGGPVCDIFCPAAVSASCSQQAMASGNTFVCTTGVALQN